MKCIECKWFAGTANDQYGVCKRYPIVQNKTQHDWCGEYVNKEIGILVTEEMVENFTNQIKRGRKPKNDN